VNQIDNSLTVSIASHSSSHSYICNLLVVMKGGSFLSVPVAAERSEPIHRERLCDIVIRKQFLRTE